jgi:hypothetical protein
MVRGSVNRHGSEHLLTVTGRGTTRIGRRTLSNRKKEIEMAISTKLLRAMTEKGWGEYCMVEKKALHTIANELDALRTPRKSTGEVQYQARLREPLLPECNVWMNIAEAGANSIRAKHNDVYEVRELVERTEYANAQLAAAATQACLCRTGADGWIFENTAQLQAFLYSLK